MKLGRYFDARVTGLVASGIVPLSHLAQTDQLAMAVVAMALFGMGHGVLTVSFGFITNLYFRQEIYGLQRLVAAAHCGLRLDLGLAARCSPWGVICVAVMIGMSRLYGFVCLSVVSQTNKQHSPHAMIKGAPGRHRA